LLGSPSKSGRSLASSFLAPAGTFRLKLSDATSAPVLHALTLIVYSGDPAIFELVMA
jgi:hypothetical protein